MTADDDNDGDDNGVNTIQSKRMKIEGQITTTWMMILLAMLIADENDGDKKNPSLS